MYPRKTCKPVSTPAFLYKVWCNKKSSSGAKCFAAYCATLLLDYNPITTKALFCFHHLIILIIGTRSTGLMLANQLNRFGINFLIADTKSSPTKQSRALAVSARSMELYQQLNLSDTVLEESTDVVGFKIFMDGKNRTDISLKELGKGLLDFENFMNTFKKNKNEKLLSHNLI